MKKVGFFYIIFIIVFSCIALADVNWTAISGHDIDIESVTVGSGSWVTVVNDIINVSETGVYMMTSAFNTKLLSGVGTTVFEGSVELAGEVVINETVRTLDKIPSTQNTGVTMFQPRQKTLTPGEYNIVVKFYSDNGDVEVNNFDMTIFKVATTYDDVFIDSEQEHSHTFNSTDFTVIDTINTVTDQSTNLFTFAKVKFNASGETDIVCRLKDVGTGLYSNIIGNTITSSSQLKVSSFLAPSLVETDNRTTEVQCLTTAGIQSTISTEFFSMALKDNSGNNISSFVTGNTLTNYTNTIIAPSGVTKLASFNFTNKVDGQLFISSNVFFGENSGKFTPYFYINSTNSSIDCFTDKERTIDSDQKGSYFESSICTNITKGVEEEYSLYVQNSLANSIVIYDEILTGFEVDILDITVLNTLPTLSILSLDNNDLKTQDFNVSLFFGDTQEDSLLFNLSLGDELIINNTPAISGEYEVNWFDLGLEGFQNLSVIVWENETLDAFNSTDIVLLNLGTRHDLNITLVNYTNVSLYDYNTSVLIDSGLSINQSQVLNNSYNLYFEVDNITINVSGVKLNNDSYSFSYQENPSITFPTVVYRDLRTFKSNISVANDSNSVVELNYTYNLGRITKESSLTVYGSNGEYWYELSCSVDESNNLISFSHEYLYYKFVQKEGVESSSMGGGSSIISDRELKNNCGIIIDPEEFHFSDLGEKVLTVFNNGDYDYEVTLEILDDLEGFDVQSYLMVDSGDVANINISYDYLKNYTGNTSLVLHSGFCGDYIIPIYFGEEKESSIIEKTAEVVKDFYGMIFSPVKDKIEIGDVEIDFSLVLILYVWLFWFIVVVLVLWKPLAYSIENKMHLYIVFWVLTIVLLSLFATWLTVVLVRRNL